MRSPYFPPADEKSCPLARRWLGSKRYWLFQAGGWGLFWLVINLGSLTSGAAEIVIRNEVAGQSLLVAAFVVSSHLLRVLLLYLRRKNLPSSRFFLWLATAVLMAGAAVVGPWLYWGSLFAEPSDMPHDSGLVFATCVFHFGVSLVLAIWVCLYFGYHYYIRYQQGLVEGLKLATAVKDAELRALRAQINPHFLFNSLNTLRALIPKDLERPREAVTLLADLLRASLTVGHHRVVSLAEELETVKNYLALEQLRFETRLRVRLETSPASLGLRLPPFVLQTLVENAIKYGVSPYEDGGDLAICCGERDGGLALEVRNRGSLAGNGAGTGLGLANARSRLQHFCGPRAMLTLTQEGDQVVARVHAPQTPANFSLHESSAHR